MAWQYPAGARARVARVQLFLFANAPRNARTEWARKQARRGARPLQGGGTARDSAMRGVFASRSHTHTHTHSARARLCHCARARGEIYEKNSGPVRQASCWIRRVQTHVPVSRAGDSHRSVRGHRANHDGIGYWLWIRAGAPLRLRHALLAHRPRLISRLQKAHV